MKTTHMKKFAVLAIALSLIGGVALAPASMAAAPTRSISVNAEGTVKVTPDAVRMSATATVVAASNKEALAETGKVAAAVRAALLDNGVARQRSQHNLFLLILSTATHQRADQSLLDTAHHNHLL